MVQRLDTVATRTTKLESIAKNNKESIRSIEHEVSSLKEIVAEQDITINGLKHYKAEYEAKYDQKLDSLRETIAKQQEQLDRQKQDHKVEELKQLIQNQEEEISNQQADLNALTKSTREFKVDLYDHLVQDKEEAHFEKLKDKAFHNRRNIIIVGLPEDSRFSAFAEAQYFLKTELKLTRLYIDIAYRIGTPPTEDNQYVRPLLISFATVADRKAVWKKRARISMTGEGGRKVKMQADLPKELRNDLQILHRVEQAASRLPKFQNASVKNFCLSLHGKEYRAKDLEDLPSEIRPSTLASKQSQDSLVFYSKHSIFSSHHPAEFTVKSQKFYNMEHFLAYKRAKLSGLKSVIAEARKAKDPVEAKKILHRLREDHPQEWERDVAEVAAVGIRAKFSQDPYLLDQLLATTPLQLGEASTNQRWGIGMPLHHEDVLDQTKWLPTGNLLGQVLMRIRSELITHRDHPNSHQEDDNDTTAIKAVVPQAQKGKAPTGTQKAGVITSNEGASDKRKNRSPAKASTTTSQPIENDRDTLMKTKVTEIQGEKTNVTEKQGEKNTLRSLQKENKTSTPQNRD